MNLLECCTGKALSGKLRRIMPTAYPVNHGAYSFIDPEVTSATPYIWGEPCECSTLKERTLRTNKALTMVRQLKGSMCDYASYIHR